MPACELLLSWTSSSELNSPKYCETVLQPRKHSRRLLCPRLQPSHTSFQGQSRGSASCSSSPHHHRGWSSSRRSYFWCERVGKTCSCATVAVKRKQKHVETCLTNARRDDTLTVNRNYYICHTQRSMCLQQPPVFLSKQSWQTSQVRVRVRVWSENLPLSFQWGHSVFYFDVYTTSAALSLNLLL